MQRTQSDRQILSVSQLNRSVRHLIETQLPLLWVEGEISNFARPASGHWYLTLKDDQAQVRCAMFRNTNQRVAFKPANGNKVLVRCRAGLYEGRGEYQLIVEHMEEAGFGALQRQFDQLKASLASEGLFDSAHKKSMPQAVNHVGIITSPTGAAVKDVLSVLKRRFPAIKVSIFPTAVQGDQAAGQIVDAIAMANQHNQCDALIIGRGGGSLEDLWPFNEESVARAIFDSQIPTISAVGHEIDFTIADFVADLRAPTPSAAAELVSPDGSEMHAQFKGLEASLINTVHRRLQKYDQNVVNLHKRLRHPGRKLQEQAQHLDHLDIRLKRAVRSRIEQHQHQTILKRDRLLRQHSKSLLTEYGQKVKDAVGQLSKSVSQQLNAKMRHAEQTIHLLDAVSPLKILSRGFSVIRDDKNVVIKSVSSVSLGENLKGRVADGEIHFAVTKTTKNDRSEH
ncbi:MAG: exodeoxyribonuclease VII large subunit [Porticoccaceae bacterium]|nr:exodeoxyribonuclease VII large subunit [Porticoccaceae bacterium]